MSYVVLAPLVQLKVKDAAGAWVYVQKYAGAVLDTDKLEVDEQVLQSHLDSGQIVDEGEKVAEVFAVPAGSPLPGKPPNVAPSESGDAATTAQPAVPLSANLLRAAEIDATGDEPYAAESTDRDEAARRAGGKPDGRASEARWREYAVSQGVDPAEAEKMSKAELVAQYK
jgi:hypothetical protein